jgi:NAD(P)-dependent dehydrogenase (short-subunit alcohol dehydrogenase family)
MRTIHQLMALNGRTALVTGGAGHIGRAMASALAEVGAAVVLVDCIPQAAQAAAGEMARETGATVLGWDIDLSDEAATRGLPDRVVQALGRLDILINCAAFVGTSGLSGWVVPFEEQASEAWRMALEVNLTAPFVLCQAATPHLHASGRGSIINVASIYGMLGPDWRLYADTAMGNPAAYGASKSGLLQLTRWLSTTLAPDIRVNAVTPGGVWRNQPEVFQERYVGRTPLGRMGIEEDFKGAALYLASDLSAYVTGENIIVDGGFSAW